MIQSGLRGHFPVPPQYVMCHDESVIGWTYVIFNYIFSLFGWQNRVWVLYNGVWGWRDIWSLWFTNLLKTSRETNYLFGRLKLLIIDLLIIYWWFIDDLFWFLGVKMLAKLHSIDITKIDGLNQLTKSSRSKINKSKINKSSNSSSNKGRSRGYYERMLNTMKKVEKKRNWYHPPFHPISLFFNYRSIQINLHLFLYNHLSLFNLKMRFVINYHKLYQTE